MRWGRLAIVVVAAVLAAACASLPSGFEQLPSHTWPHPESSELGRAVRAHQTADAPDSGVLLLADPQEAFQSRVALIRLAEHTLDLQYFLWKGDLTGKLLLQRVLEAADRGVRVRVLMDDAYHAGRDETYAAIDAHPQVEIRVFNPAGNRGVGRNVNYLYRKRVLNRRMHNKIFLADNAVAILGGRNIGDDYFGIDPKLNFRDLEVLVVGAAARETGAAFDLYWNSPAAVPIAELAKKKAGEAELLRLRGPIATSAAISEGVPYPIPADREDSRSWVEAMAERLVWADSTVVVDPLERFNGGAESAFVRLARELDESVDSELVAQTAYLIPSADGIAAMRRLVDRGVRVRVLTNSLLSNNHVVVHAHYKKYRKQLIRAGVELHELRADAELLEHFKEVEYRIADSHAGLHTKAFVFDREISLIASYNMDPRSRVWNSEIGLLVRNRDFASIVLAEMEKDFDPANSYRVLLDDDDHLRWVASGPDGVVEWRREPEASWWRRFGARILSWLPFENQL